MNQCIFSIKIFELQKKFLMWNEVLDILNPKSTGLFGTGKARGGGVFPPPTVKFDSVSLEHWSLEGS